MISFKSFLLLEGGHATDKYGTTRANKSDIEAAIHSTARIIGASADDLKKSLLGSTELTLIGKKKDSGDIDIALQMSDYNYTTIHKKMMAEFGGEGYFNQGAKIGSYAVPVNGKKVQVDLMYVSDNQWAKFIYHSAQGNGSNYPGAVRNIIMFTVLTFIQEPGKDFVHRNEEGRVVARASRSIKLDTGMTRLFKRSKINSKTGEHNKSLETVQPDELEAHLKSIGKATAFDKSTDVIKTPDAVASFIFGAKVKAADIMTAEDVIKHAKNLPEYPKMVKKIISELERNKLPVPKELK